MSIELDVAIPRKVGEKIALHHVRYGQDFSVWERDFEGMEFTVDGVLMGEPMNPCYKLVADGFGVLNGNDAAYGNGAVYIYENNLAKP